MLVSDCFTKCLKSLHLKEYPCHDRSNKNVRSFMLTFYYSILVIICNLRYLIPLKASYLICGKRVIFTINKLVF